MNTSQMKSLLETYLATFEETYATLTVHVGPDMPRIPDWFIVVSRTGGPGESVEGLFDGIGYQVRVAGWQHDPGSAEDVADLIDQYLRSLTTGSYQGRWVASIHRTGSGPSHLLVDDANRTHFVCGYVVDVHS